MIISRLVLFVPAVEEIGGVIVTCGIVAFAKGVHAAPEIREVLAVPTTSSPWRMTAGATVVCVSGV